MTEIVSHHHDFFVVLGRCTFFVSSDHPEHLIPLVLVHFFHHFLGLVAIKKQLECMHQLSSHIGPVKMRPNSSNFILNPFQYFLIQSQCAKPLFRNWNRIFARRTIVYNADVIRANPLQSRVFTVYHIVPTSHLCSRLIKFLGRSAGDHRLRSPDQCNTLTIVNHVRNKF